MSTLDEQDIILLQRIKRHPLLRARVESLLGVAEDSEGDLEKADAAERRVICRATSVPLQRVLVDFCADHAFGRVPDKLREHYGIDMPVSTIRLATEHHAQCIFEQEMAREIQAEPAQGRTFISEMDGSMVPVVEVAKDADDKRKGKALVWKEARPCIAHATGSVMPVFGGHFAGGVEESRRQWERCAGVAPVLARTATCMRWATVRRGSPTKWRPGSASRGAIWWISSTFANAWGRRPRPVPPTMPVTGCNGQVKPDTFLGSLAVIIPFKFQRRLIPQF